MFDVVALGEILIDFTPAGFSNAGNVLFERNPGGAPANVLVALARFGKKTSFIGKAGKDQFGIFLEKTLSVQGVDTSGFVFSDSINTTLAFVHLNDRGDRSFSFYRNPGADMTLSEDDLKLELIDGAKVFHFGSVSMTNEPSRYATMKAVKYAKEKGIMVSYDPNLRILLWNNIDEARKIITEGLKYSDLLKISEEELIFLAGDMGLEAGTQYIRKKFGIDLIFVTLGRHGSFYRIRRNTGRVHAYDVVTVDTTGAGDAFMGGILFKILESNRKLKELEHHDVEMYVNFANAAGSLATVKNGAIPAMPSLDEVFHCVNSIPKLVI
jgi:fructokinase